jgi:hypothetical protein
MMTATAEREGHAGERNYRRGRRRVLDEHASAAVFGLNEPHPLSVLKNLTIHFSHYPFLSK